MVVCGWRCAFAVPVAVTVLGILSVAADSHSSRLLIETQDLAGLLSNHAVRILDARPADEYRQGHIPGAVNLPAPATDDLGANRRGLPLPSDRAEELFRTACVNNNSRVVVYDDQGNRFAARLFYVLESFGHSQVQVLNGGIPKWKSEGRPLSKEVPTLRAGDFIPKVDASRAVTSSWVLDHLKDPQVAIIDARSPEEFRGEKVLGPRGGHIPGAINIEWTRTIEPGIVRTLLSDDQLEQLFRVPSLTPEKTVVTYCQMGMRASQIYFALRLLGYEKVRIYDGSWEDWSVNPNLPIDK